MVEEQKTPIHPFMIRSVAGFTFGVDLPNTPMARRKVAQYILRQERPDDRRFQQYERYINNQQWADKIMELTAIYTDLERG